MKRLLTLCLLSPVACLLGAIDGVVQNATTGTTQAGVAVTLVQPGAGGMQTLGMATSDAQGKFSFDQPTPQGPALIQGIYKDVTYTLVLQPGAPTQGVKLAVYDTTNKLASAKLSQHIWIFESGDTDLHVSEMFLLDNETNATFSDPVKGSVQVYIPGEPKDLAATVEGAAGMSIRRPLEKTSTPNVYKLAYAIKPGESRIDIAYTIPRADKYTWKVLRTDGPTRAATPAGVTMTGTGIRDLGLEQQTQAHIYDITAPVIEVSIKGSGALRRGNQDANAPKEDDGSPKPEVTDARVYSRLWWVMGLAGGILALGGTMLFRKGRIAGDPRA